MAASRKKAPDDPQPLLGALMHPLRRHILRAMPDDGPISPGRLAEDLDEDLRHVSYHVRVLAGYEAVELVEETRFRGSTKHIYRRTVTAPWALALLAETERERRRGRPRRRKRS